MFSRSALLRAHVAIGLVLLGGVTALCSSCGARSHAAAVSASYDHTCALLSNHSVECWGANWAGQLGNGRTKKSSIPVRVSAVTNASQVSAGTDHTCALLSSHKVECWGANAVGQLGDGKSGVDENGNDIYSPTPVPVKGITNATQVSAGGDYACALLSSHKVECWGVNAVGQLGNGKKITISFSSTPVPVKGITNAVKLSAGGGHACALLSSHKVECWGWNRDGQLGNRRTKNSSTPVPVKGVTNASQVSAGGNYTCALLSNHRVECWGWNRYGQLGDGKKANSSTPVLVKDVTNATQVSTSFDHTCALLSNHRIECWGDSSSGQLGNGRTNKNSTPVPTPVPVRGITNAVQVSAGPEYTCALLSNHSVKCWGYNYYGQLGNGSTTAFISTPVSVVGIG